MRGFLTTPKVKEEDGNLAFWLPEPEKLDEVLGTSKWMIRQATKELEALTAGSDRIEVVGPPEGPPGDSGHACSDSKLEW